jgi:hypothetical protein
MLCARASNERRVPSLNGRCDIRKPLGVESARG